MGILPLSHFAFLNQIYRGEGEKESFFMINQNGYALSYSEKAYIGSSLNSHPLSEKILSQSLPRLVGEFQYGGGKQSFFASSKLKNSNLFLAMERQALSFFGSLLPFLTQKLAVKVLAFLFLSLLFGIWFARTPLKHLSYLRQSVLDLIENRKIKRPPFDEVYEISKSLNMLQRLKSKIQDFEKQLEEEKIQIKKEGDFKYKKAFKAGNQNFYHST